MRQFAGPPPHRRDDAPTCRSAIAPAGCPLHDRPLDSTRILETSKTAKGTSALQAPISTAQRQILAWLKTFTRLGKATLARGGPVFYKWQGNCEK
jgi:hypothetical protein